MPALWAQADGELLGQELVGASVSAGHPPRRIERRRADVTGVDLGPTDAPADLLLEGIATLAAPSEGLGYGYAIIRSDFDENCNAGCPDGNSCTSDSCVGGFCHHTDLPACTACDDGQACYGPDTCDAAGICSGPLVGCGYPADMCAINTCVGPGGCQTDAPTTEDLCDVVRFYGVVQLADDSLGSITCWQDGATGDVGCEMWDGALKIWPPRCGETP